MFKFVISAASNKDWEAYNDKKIVTFWGRSNVGKSSLINALANSKIARVSKTPGRTQLVNFFVDEHDYHIADLPGYGYANISKDKQEKMLKNIANFLTDRASNKFLFLLVDSRLGFTNIDLEVLDYLKQIDIQFAVIYTKNDKLNQREKTVLIKKHNELIANNILANDVEYFVASVSNQKQIELIRNKMFSIFN